MAENPPHMKSASLNLPRLLFLLAALLFAGAGNAYAKRVPKLITFGDDFYEMGDVKANAEDIGVSGVKVGYHCQALGLFWVNIFTWSGEYCLYKGSGLETKQYEPISQEQAAEYLGVAKVGKPWNYSFPPGMLAIIGLVGLKVVPRLLAKKRAAAFNAPSAASVPSAPTQSWHGGGMVPSRPAPPVGQAPQAPESYAPPQTPPPVPPPLPPDQQ